MAVQPVMEQSNHEQQVPTHTKNDGKNLSKRTYLSANVCIVQLKTVTCTTHNITSQIDKPCTKDEMKHKEHSETNMFSDTL